jgi:MinD superfamily P-loop ATPase
VYATVCDAATDTHSSCLEGYFVSSGTCTTCGDNIKTCTSGSSASACLDGYNLISNACFPCATGVLVCTSATSQSDSVLAGKAGSC